MDLVSEFRRKFLSAPKRFITKRLKLRKTVKAKLIYIDEKPIERPKKKALG